MKKFIILFLFIAISTNIKAQNYGAIRLGYFNPEVSEGGFIIGYEAGKKIDRNFDIGISLDWFNKSYTDKRLVAELNDYFGGVNSRINEIRAKTSINEFPLLVNATIKFPMNRYNYIYLTGGVGGELLIIKYRDFQDPNLDEIKSAFDFSWRAGAGIAARLGRRSVIFGEISYHNSKPNWTYKVYDDIIKRERTFERVYDLSGIMIRGGLKFYF